MIRGARFLCPRLGAGQITGGYEASSLEAWGPLLRQAKPDWGSGHRRPPGTGKAPALSVSLNLTPEPKPAELGGCDAPLRRCLHPTAFWIRATKRAVCMRTRLKIGSPVKIMATTEGNLPLLLSSSSISSPANQRCQVSSYCLNALSKLGKRAAVPKQRHSSSAAIATSAPLLGQKPKHLL